MLRDNSLPAPLGFVGASGGVFAMLAHDAIRGSRDKVLAAVRHSSSHSFFSQVGGVYFWMYLGDPGIVKDAPVVVLNLLLIHAPKITTPTQKIEANMGSKFVNVFVDTVNTQPIEESIMDISDITPNDSSDIGVSEMVWLCCSHVNFLAIHFTYPRVAGSQSGFVTTGFILGSLPM